MNQYDLMLVRIYTQADELRKMAPWMQLYETDVFGIQIQGSDTPWYVSVMGSDGSFPAVSVYEGNTALCDFMELQFHEHEIAAEDIFMIPHLMLSFEDRENLETEERKKLKELGFKFRGKGGWPVLRKITPGHPPLFPELEQLRVLDAVIEHTMLVARRAAMDELPFLRVNDNDEVTGLVRTGHDGAEPDSWTDEHRTIPFETTSIPVQYNHGLVERIDRIPQSDHVLEVDMPVMPSPVPDRVPPYFPFILLVLDKESGYIMHFEMLTPHPSALEMYGRCGNVLVEALLKAKIHPRTILVKSPRLFEVFDSVLEHTNIRIDFKSSLPMVKEAYMSLIDHLSRGHA